jgi:hypothetical protein
LTADVRHAGPVASVAFSRNTAIHEMRLLTSGWADLVRHALTYADVC